MVAASEFPVLTDAEVETLLGMCRLPDIDDFNPDSLASWVPLMTYTAGSLVVPAVRNGYYYSASNGTSAATPPAWPVSGTVVDGTVTWTFAGSAPWVPTYNLNIGAAEGWRWKAGKLANRYDFTQELRGMTRSQMHAMMMQQVEMYERRIISGVPTRGNTRIYNPVIGNLGI